MSLMAIVYRLVKDRGEATVDDLLPVAGYTRQQVLLALQNCKSIGCLECVRGAGKGVALGSGTFPGTYRVKAGARPPMFKNRPSGPPRPRAAPKEPKPPAPAMPRVASVWELGAHL